MTTSEPRTAVALPAPDSPDLHTSAASGDNVPGHAELGGSARVISDLPFTQRVTADTLKADRRSSLSSRAGGDPGGRLAKLFRRSALTRQDRVVTELARYAACE